MLPIRLLAGLLVSYSVAASSAQVQPNTSPKPLPPSQDPFYTAPKGFEKTAPGTILRIRHAPGNITTVVTNSSAVYNIVYRTTDSNYKPAFAVTTVFVPFQNVTDSSKSSLLSIQIPYNSLWLDASPSYGVYYDFAQPAVGSRPINDDTSYALGQGWFVNMPDHEGPTASFALGIQVGHATLDSIRAVLASGLLPSRVRTKYALWGYSGGSISSEWASELQEQYAPELSFSGMAIGGCVPNMTEVGDALSGSAFAGLTVTTYLALTSQDQDARKYLVSRLKTTGAHNATGFLANLKYSVVNTFTTYANQDIFSYFVNGRADLDAPILQKIARKNFYQGYHGIPQMPVFVYKSIHDEFSVITSTDALVERWCGIGTDVRYDRNTVGGHTSEITNGRERALDWLKSVFDGTLKTDGCVVKDVTIDVGGTHTPL